MNYSVLMSVYWKERPEYLKESMESIYCQSVKTNDFVLVCDGPLNDELYEVIDEMKNKFGESLHILQLKKNVGLGDALEAGIKECRNEIIARMDSDDIARPERCEKQLHCFEKNPELSIVSGTVEEFIDIPEQVYSRRVLPSKHEDILEFAKVRNPFNHPCVMYKKEAVEEAGGYQHFYLLEDYFLWVRMLMNGNKAMNLEAPLLWMRAGSDMYKRRGGLKYAISQIKFVAYLKKNRFISFPQYCISTIVRAGGALLPNAIRKKIYEKKLRNISNN